MQPIENSQSRAGVRKNAAAGAAACKATQQTKDREADQAEIPAALRHIRDGKWQQWRQQVELFLDAETPRVQQRLGARVVIEVSRLLGEEDVRDASKAEAPLRAAATKSPGMRRNAETAKLIITTKQSAGNVRRTRRP
jgi:hypothetical protein